MNSKNGNDLVATPHYDKDKHGVPNSDPTDGRESGEWKSKYPKEAWVKIWIEAIFLLITLLCAFFVIFLAWNGYLGKFLSLPFERENVFKRYVYYSASGICGGITFDIKFLYRSVARLRWHQDRKIWRFLSPVIAMTVAFIIGAMINASLIPTKIPVQGSAFVSIGFLSGYFADNAVSKMSEIAAVLFGKSETTKDINR